VGLEIYEVTIENLTHGQPLSPPLFATHGPQVMLWQEGRPAPKPVRQVAETGLSSNLADALRDRATDVVVIPSAVMPGERVTVLVQARRGDSLSAITMLERTNDGFTGLNALPLDAAGAFETGAFDAGTEENTERSDDIPGSPFLGTRGTPTDPPQPIHPHPGVRGVGDLGREHAFSGPIARFTIRRR
jgi:hypothetical protein